MTFLNLITSFQVLRLLKFDIVLIYLLNCILIDGTTYITYTAIDKNIPPNTPSNGENIITNKVKHPLDLVNANIIAPKNPMINSKAIESKIIIAAIIRTNGNPKIIKNEVSIG